MTSPSTPEELAARLTDAQREVLIAGGGEIDCDDGYGLEALGLMVADERSRGDEHQGFDLTPLGNDLAAALRASSQKAKRYELEVLEASRDGLLSVKCRRC